MLHKVLIVVSRDDYREIAHELTEGLRQYGYSPKFCRADVNSQVMADKILDQDTTLSGYDGVIFLDEGADLKSAILLAQRAKAGNLVVAARRRGLWVLHKAGLLAEGYVCAGMPKSFYSKGMKRVKSLSVRSDKLVTSMSKGSGEFVIMCLDALGGKIKKIIRSSNSKQATELIDSREECSRLLSETCCDATATYVNGPNADLAAVAKELVASGTRYVRSLERGRPPLLVHGRGDKAIVSYRRQGSAAHKIMSEEQLAAMLSDERFMVQSSVGGAHIGDMAFEAYLVMAHGPEGWKPRAALARGGQVTPADVYCSLEPAMAAMYPDAKDSMISAALAAAETACVTIQAATDDGLNQLGVSIVFNGSTPNVVDVDHGDISDVVIQDVKLASTGRAIGKVITAAGSGMADRQMHRRLLERELANEGIWMQPDGRIAIERRNSVMALGVAEAIEELVNDAQMATDREIEERKEGKQGKARLLARRARHKLNLARDLAKMLALTDPKTASSLYPSGVQGWHANLDIPIFERVFDWDDDDVTDREKAISQQTRYHPEYERMSPDDAYGKYYVWHEENNAPFKFEDRDDEDPYKRRTILDNA